MSYLSFSENIYVVFVLDWTYLKAFSYNSKNMDSLTLEKLANFLLITLCWAFKSVDVEGEKLPATQLHLLWAIVKLTYPDSSFSVRRLLYLWSAVISVDPQPA